MADIHLKRAYDEPASTDGQRILVDGIWPRGVSKDALRLTDWIKHIAPSKRLRQWFGHDPEKWDTFRASYRKELEDAPEAAGCLKSYAEKGRVTLIFAAKDDAHNNAVVLKEWLEERT